MLKGLFTWQDIHVVGNMVIILSDMMSYARRWANNDIDTHEQRFVQVPEI